MSELIEIAKTDELRDGEMKEFSEVGHGILLARAGDTYYATDARCPHMGGHLAKGTLEGTIVTCPLHGSQFDLSTGQVIRWLKKSGPLETISKVIKHEQSLNTYTVKVEGNVIKIEK
jgi:3-phenylpropionate/trans-cinnamate dioxygenase ferredoxin subunit